MEVETVTEVRIRAVSEITRHCQVRVYRITMTT